MILAVLDDLMFTSKIKTTASGLGVPVVFARSAEGALAEMRKTTPQLVIFDLNNARTRPLEIVAAMKADAAVLTYDKHFGFIPGLRVVRDYPGQP